MPPSPVSSASRRPGTPPSPPANDGILVRDGALCHCGNRLSLGNLFCPNCGAKITDAPVESLRALCAAPTVNSTLELSCSSLGAFDREQRLEVMLQLASVQVETALAEERKIRRKELSDLRLHVAETVRASAEQFAQPCAALRRELLCGMETFGGELAGTFVGEVARLDAQLAELTGKKEATEGGELQVEVPKRVEDLSHLMQQATDRVEARVMSALAAEREARKEEIVKLECQLRQGVEALSLAEGAIADERPCVGVGAHLTPLEGACAALVSEVARARARTLQAEEAEEALPLQGRFDPSLADGARVPPEHACVTLRAFPARSPWTGPHESEVHLQELTRVAQQLAGAVLPAIDSMRCDLLRLDGEIAVEHAGRCKAIADLEERLGSAPLPSLPRPQSAYGEEPLSARTLCPTPRDHEIPDTAAEEVTSPGPRSSDEEPAPPMSPADELETELAAGDGSSGPSSPQATGCPGFPACRRDTAEAAPQDAIRGASRPSWRSPLQHEGTRGGAALPSGGPMPWPYSANMN